MDRLVTFPEKREQDVVNQFIKSEMMDDAISVSELKILYNSSGPAGRADGEKKTEGSISTNFEKFGKSVDFVLVYSNDTASRDTNCSPDDECDENIRMIFEGNLTDEGLELEKDLVNGLTFVKIHAPRPVLRKYCEILKLKMPMRQTKEETSSMLHDFNLISNVKTACKKFIRFFITIDPEKYKERNILYAEYNVDKNYLFDDNSPSFFTPTVRMLVADFILNRSKWTTDEENLRSVGIQTLLDDGVYKAAYPLHDGAYEQKGSLRNQLGVEWAAVDKWIRLQPIDDVKEYLGVKYAFYFAWLGFYTQLLIPAAILGICVFIYGFIFLNTDEYSRYVCEKGANVTMCPLCDKVCNYWTLEDNCLYAKITYLLDNDFAVVFAFLMSVWATLFLELWKRHAAVLSHCWGLTNYSSQSEHPRPQYLAKLANVKNTKLNIDTNQREPIMSFWLYKLPTVVFSYTVVIMFILIVIAVVLSIVIFRMWLHVVDASALPSSWFKTYSFILIPTAVGLLNLITIMILNSIYSNIANYLTTLELPRTQTEFENSLSIKLYVFQFVNYYASIMYVAFFKGKFVGYPSHYNKIFGFRQEECNSGGCVIELSIQLAIIMVGQQLMNGIMEMTIPAVWRWFNHYSLKKNEINGGEELDKRAVKPWCEDYKLLDWGTQGLFSDYLEIATQFGFVTLFASAFPLAPLFALINNIFELRLDAQKILRFYRRPVPYQIPNIGVWYRITDVIGKMAVVFNAGIIAFSSNLIPRIIYSLERSQLGIEFAEFSLSSFDVFNEKFANETAPYPYISNDFQPSQCRYYGYRESTTDASSADPQRSMIFWKILAARLLFMFFFQNTVFITKTAIQWIIPDVPSKLSERIKKESRIITNLVIKRETELALNKAGLNGNETEHIHKLNDA